MKEPLLRKSPQQQQQQKQKQQQSKRQQQQQQYQRQKAEDRKEIIMDHHHDHNTNDNHLKERVLRRVIMLVPANAPQVWVAINVICFLWSILLVIAIANEEEEEESSKGLLLLERLENARYYMTWNFGTTLIWCLEAGLTAWYAKHIGNKWVWTHLIELIIAIYFLVDSIHLWIQWKKHPDVDVKGELYDTIINAIVYTYAIWVTQKGLYQKDVREYSSYHGCLCCKKFNPESYASLV